MKVNFELPGFLAILFIIIFSAKVFGFISLSWWWIVGFLVGYIFLVLIGFIAIIIAFRRFG